MCDLARQTFGKVDDFDGGEGTSFHAHTAANAEVLGDFANRRALPNFDTDLSILVNRACLLASECALDNVTFVAPIGVYDSDS